MMDLRRIRRHWRLVVGVFLVSVVLVVTNEASTERANLAAGTARVTTPDIDVTRPTARAVDLDELVEAAQQSDPSLRVFRIGDARVQVFAGGSDALPKVGATLERLADDAVRQQADSDLPVDERVTPRLFIRIPGPVPGDTVTEPTAGEVSEVVGTLVLEDPTAARNPIESARMGARLLQVVTTSDESRAQLQRELGQGTTHSFQLPRRGSDGLMDIAVTANDPDAAVAGFGVIVGFLETVLRTRQSDAGVPQREQFIIEVVDRPLQADALASVVAPRTLAILALGLALALVMPSLLDRRHNHAVTMSTEEVGASNESDAGGSHEAGSAVDARWPFPMHSSRTGVRRG